MVAHDRSRDNALTPPEAHALIAQHQNEAPVNVAALAQAMGLNIYSAALPEGVSGKLFFDDHLGYVAHVNRAEDFDRQRFTAAHQIAHFILHRNEIVGDGIVDDVLYRSKLTAADEAEANTLAAEILMPWDLIDKLTKKGVRDIGKLAEALQVSRTALAVRLGMPT
jgi:Zn-dependent peptidase ImmA (M78 family)